MRTTAEIVTFVLYFCAATFAATALCIGAASLWAMMRGKQ